MENKFKMTLEDNIIYAKRNIVDTIYKNANLEGINVTFPDTQSIIEGVNIANLNVLDIEKIINMKHSWEFIIDTVDLPINFAYILEAHKQIARELGSNAGKIRSVPVSMGGTKWKPQFPIESQIKEELDEILSIGNPTERAIEIMIWGMKRQMFLDGNKRVSMLIANKILIENGCGIIAVPKEKLSEFGKLLIDYYENDIKEPLTNFIYEECIDGFDSLEYEKDIINDYGVDM